MRKLARLLAFVLLAAFAAATTVPVADATAMAIQMSFADDSSGCDGCPGDEKLPACDQACAVWLAALPAASSTAGPVAAADLAAAPADLVAGLTGPPEPSPPRSSS